MEDDYCTPLRERTNRDVIMDATPMASLRTPFTPQSMLVPGCVDTASIAQGVENAAGTGLDSAGAGCAPTSPRPSLGALFASSRMASFGWMRALAGACDRVAGWCLGIVYIGGDSVAARCGNVGCLHAGGTLSLRALMSMCCDVAGGRTVSAGRAGRSAAGPRALAALAAAHAPPRRRATARGRRARRARVRRRSGSSSSSSARAPCACRRWARCAARRPGARTRRARCARATSRPATTGAPVQLPPTSCARLGIHVPSDACAETTRVELRTGLVERRMHSHPVGFGDTDE
jgi:hypothetical protein